MNCCSAGLPGRVFVAYYHAPQHPDQLWLPRLPSPAGPLASSTPAVPATTLASTALPAASPALLASAGLALVAALGGAAPSHLSI